MPPLKQLLARSTGLLRAHAILWTPPLAIAFISSLLGPGGSLGVMLVVTTLIGLAVSAGWYALIGRADTGATPSWDDFFVAVGRFFTTLITGSLAFGLLGVALAVPLIVAGGQWIGLERLERLRKDLPPLLEKAQDQPELLTRMDPALMQTVTHFLLLLAGIALIYGILSVALVFWKQAVVLGELDWVAGWRRSLRLVRDAWRPLMALLTLQGLSYLGAVLLSAMPFPLGAVGWVSLLMTQTFYTVALTLLYLQAYPLKTTDAGLESPTGLAS